jgi:hypothetical protein
MNRRYTRIVLTGLFLALLSFPATATQAGNLTLGATDFARVLGPGGALVTSILYKFDLPDTLAIARVDRALLRLPLIADTVVQEFALLALPAADNWAGGGATLSLPGLGVVDSVSGVYTSQLSPGETVEVDVTDLVKAWASGQIANKGLVIRSMTDEPEPMEIPGRLAFPAAGQVDLEVWFAPSPGR